MLLILPQERCSLAGPSGTPEVSQGFGLHGASMWKVPWQVVCIEIVQLPSVPQQAPMQLLRRHGQGFGLQGYPPGKITPESVAQTSGVTNRQDPSTRQHGPGCGQRRAADRARRR